MKISRVSYEEKRDYLLHYMGSVTYDVLCNKLNGAVQQANTFEEIVTLLKELFSSKPLENYECANRKQLEGESLIEHPMDLEKLSGNFEFGDYRDKALRKQFVFGIRNRAIQLRLLEVRELTLAKAKDIAFDMEVSSNGATELQGP